MTFGTCTLQRSDSRATFGWSNNAAHEKFLQHIERRIAAGVRFWVIRPPRLRLLFNRRMAVDNGVTPSMMELVKKEVGDMLRTGDVSILDFQGVAAVVRPASSAIDILHQHTLCQKQDELLDGKV